MELAQIGAVIDLPAIGGLAGTILSGIFSSRLIARSGKRQAGLIVPIIVLPLAAPAFALSVCSVPAGGDCWDRFIEFHVVEFARPLRRAWDSLVSPNRRCLTSTIVLIVQTIVAFSLAPLIGPPAMPLSRLWQGSVTHALGLMLVTPLAASLLLWIPRRRIVAR